MKILGLTGSIATGKSFIANIMANKKIKSFSSDAAVAELLQSTEVIESIKQSKELSAAVKQGKIDKESLSHIVFNENYDALSILEKIMHPKVKEAIENFIQNNKDEKFLLLEIPLLFEKNYQSLCHKVIMTYCSERDQQERALKRTNLDKNRLNFIIKRQMAIKEKAALADYIVYTGGSKQYSEKQIEQILLKESV